MIKVRIPNTILQKEVHSFVASQVSLPYDSRSSKRALGEFSDSVLASAFSHLRINNIHEQHKQAKKKRTQVNGITKCKISRNTTTLVFVQEQPQPFLQHDIGHAQQQEANGAPVRLVIKQSLAKPAASASTTVPSTTSTTTMGRSKIMISDLMNE